MNALYIEQVQSFPDTTITLVNNKKLVVKETETEVKRLVQQFYRRIGINGCVKEMGDSI